MNPCTFLATIGRPLKVPFPASGWLAEPPFACWQTFSTLNSTRHILQ